MNNWKNFAEKINILPGIKDEEIVSEKMKDTNKNQKLRKKNYGFSLMKL